jgi:hypothetical protein
VGSLLFVLLLVALIAAFGSPVWQLLGTATLALALAITALLAIGLLVAGVASRAYRQEQAQSMTWLKRASRLAITVATLLVALGGVAAGSQLHAATPAITGANSHPLSGSIATLEQVTLNGSKQ